MFCLYDLCNIVSLLLHSVSIVVIGFKTIFFLIHFCLLKEEALASISLRRDPLKMKELSKPNRYLQKKELFLNYFNYFKIIWAEPWYGEEQKNGKACRIVMHSQVSLCREDAHFCIYFFSRSPRALCSKLCILRLSTDGEALSIE